ncbi:hypothetical protein [Streptomyces sp. NPDC093097]|uniref:hypothetical protein n=1 Tax=Streptomyces sp. NPDC093097 TaxID=3366027 RepID=UPI0037FDE71C
MRHAEREEHFATAQARRRDLDAAAETATTAIDIAAMVESGRCTTLLSNLATELEPHRAARPVGAVLNRLGSDRCCPPDAPNPDRDAAED